MIADHGEEMTLRATITFRVPSDPAGKAVAVRTMEGLLHAFLDGVRAAGGSATAEVLT